MSVTDFERRRNDILEVIVEVHISTASPVGSEFISRKIHQSLSSATIRHIMAELEEAGLLEQPHTSAGRVPTDLGYRLYVDALMDTAQLTQQELHRLLELVQPHERELERFFGRVGEVLAKESRQAAVVLQPTVKHSRVRQIELLPLGLHKLLCVLVAQETLVVSHIVEVDQPLSREEATSLAQFLNAELAGLPMRELLASLQRRLEQVDEVFSELVKRSMGILQTVLATEPEDRLLLEGALYLVEQPEFRKDPDKTHQLLRQLELRQALLERMRADLSPAPPLDAEHRQVNWNAARAGMSTSHAHVRIGRELDIEGLEDCSYILAPFGVRQTALGGVGVLGPKRMDYRRMQALVEGMANLLTDILTEWELHA